MRSPNQRRGSATIEFALCGIPMMFVWISIVEMGIGAWQYHTIQYAVKTAGNYLTVHGSDCSVGSNSCGTTIGAAAQVLKKYAIGVDPTGVTATFNAIDSDHVTVASSVTCRLDQCISNSSYSAIAWPPVNYNYPMSNDIEIKTEYQFKSALCMVAPGPGGVVKFGTVWFPGFTHQTILF